MTNLWFVNEDYPAACKSKICGQRPGRECIFSANASVCSAKNARNDVHAVISDLSLALSILCQGSEARLISALCAAFVRPCVNPSVTAAPCHRSTVRHSQSASFASSLAAFLALLGSSYRPALRWPGIPGLRSASRCSSIQHGRTPALANSLAALPASLGLLRPVSRTARGLRAPLFPSGKRRLLGRATSYGCATSQNAPLSPKGNWQRS